MFHVAKVSGGLLYNSHYVKKPHFRVQSTGIKGVGGSLSLIDEELVFSCVPLM